MSIELNSSTTTSQFNTWNIPVRVDVVEKSDCIEFIYKETLIISYTNHLPIQPKERVFKVVFSCKDGKWHKSEKIYGEIIPAEDEYYDFN